MSDALTNAFSVMLIIVVAYFFKRMRMLNVETAKRLASVVYLTLPCAILTSANGMTFDVSVLGVIIISAVVNFLLLLIACFCSSNPKQRMFNILWSRSPPPLRRWDECS